MASIPAKLFRLAFVVFALTLLSQPQSALADFEKGQAAYQRQDYATAFAEFSKAAQQGLSFAQSDLASMYLKGQGVAQDNEQALEWYRKAAQLGNPEAQKILAALKEIK